MDDDFAFRFGGYAEDNEDDRDERRDLPTAVKKKGGQLKVRVLLSTCAFTIRFLGHYQHFEAYSCHSCH